MADEVDAFLASLDDAQAAVLAPYFARARELVPEVVDGVSYGMPALKLRDKGLVSLMPTKAGFSAYPYSSAVVGAVMARHPGVEHTKGSVHFTAAAPLPMDAFEDLIRTRVAELDARKKR